MTDLEILQKAKREGKNPVTCLAGICISRTQLDPAAKFKMLQQLLMEWRRRYGEPTFDKIERWIKESKLQ
jgi:hypothetical protein